MSRKEPQPVAQVRNRLGRFIRIYPALEVAFDNANAARVFEVFLFHESDRLTRRADWFMLTDEQGAEGSGLSLRQFRDGRDILCDPFNHLFQRQRFSSFGVTHYRANLDRIHGWLTANRFEWAAPAAEDPPDTPKNPPSAPVHKMYTERYTKRAPAGAQNGIPFQNLGTDLFDDDDARARKIAIHSLLASTGIEEPTRSEIASGLAPRDDGIEIAKTIIEKTLQEFLLAEKRGRRIKSLNGLTISRLRNEYVQQTTGDQ